MKWVLWADYHTEVPILVGEFVSYQEAHAAIEHQFNDVAIEQVDEINNEFLEKKLKHHRARNYAWSFGTKLAPLGAGSLQRITYDNRNRFTNYVCTRSF